MNKTLSNTFIVALSLITVPVFAQTGGMNTPPTATPVVYSSVVTDICTAITCSDTQKTQLQAYVDAKKQNAKKEKTTITPEQTAPVVPVPAPLEISTPRESELETKLCKLQAVLIKKLVLSKDELGCTKKKEEAQKDKSIEVENMEKTDGENFIETEKTKKSEKTETKKPDSKKDTKSSEKPVEKKDNKKSETKKPTTKKEIIEEDF